MEIKLSDHFSMKKLIRFVLPSIVMMVFISVYGVVDGYFVSNFAGKTSFAAINLVMPFVMILGGMGFMVGTGGTALVAKILGEGDNERANKTFSMMIIFTVAFGIVLSILGMVFMRPVAVFFKATEEMLDDCVLYGRIITGFTVTFMLQNVFQSFLVAAEKPKLGLGVTVAAGVTNMVLDALFVGVFRWGVAGAAVATGLSQTVGGVLPLIYFMKPNSSLLRFKPARLELKPIIDALVNGSSELMSNISHSLVSILFNFQLFKYIGEDGISAYGVLMYVQFVFIGIFIGFAIGTAPIISYHYGAGNQGELKNLLKKSVVFMGIGGVVLSVLAIILSKPLAILFVGYDEGLVAITAHAFKVFAFAFLLTGFNIFVSSFFTALNNGGISATVSFIRTLLFQSTCVLVLPKLFGIDGIWLSNGIAEVFALIISIFFLLKNRKRYGYL